MYKYVFYPITITAANLGRGGKYLRVDLGLYSKIKASLFNDDWTYLQIRFGKQVEILKVVGTMAPNTLVVERAKDGTTQDTFPTGSEIEVVPTVAAVIDSFEESSLYIDTLGGIVYKNGVLFLPNLNIVGLGGVGKLNSAILGCCPVGDAPEVPLDLEPLRITGVGAVRVTSDDEYRIWR